MSDYAFHADNVDFLLSNTARDALAALQTQDLSDTQTLAVLTTLRTRFEPSQAAALLTQARLRRRAEAKFPAAHQMYFTPTALEQATTWTVADHRAQEIHRLAPQGTVADLGCGIGGDALALASYRRVIAYEQDAVRLHFAQANARALKRNNQIEFRQGDWRTEWRRGPPHPIAAAYADPGRRVAGRRVFRLHEMDPTLSDLMKQTSGLPLLVVKVMPGVDRDELPPTCGVEFVSHHGTCKEAVLWFHPTLAGLRWASVHTNSGWKTLRASGRQAPMGSLQPGYLLHEPDPAVIRAGALTELCDLLEAHLFDPHIAYLVSSAVRHHPLARTFLVREVHPFGLKRLSRRLQELGIGRVELKKRGFPTEPEQLRSRLQLADSADEAVIVFTRQGADHLMLICVRLDEGAELDHRSARGW